jgi:hypothetical protein
MASTGEANKEGRWGLAMKNNPMFLPLTRGSLNVSAMMPGTTAMGELAKTPVKSRKTRNPAQVAASAQASVHRVNMKKVQSVSTFRPNCSLRGPQRIGPGFFSIS